MRRLFVLVALLAAAWPAFAQDLLVPMDDRQGQHLKAYGVAYRAIAAGNEVEWLVNYRGGAFLFPANDGIEGDLRAKGVLYERLSGADVAQVLGDVAAPEATSTAIRLERVPKIAVYAPPQSLPWDDAVLMALDFAEIPYTKIYDDEVLRGDLRTYDWLHLHHEDFTGQYSKFIQYQGEPWYREQKATAEQSAAAHGFDRVPELKLAVAEAIRGWVEGGGFLFAMCSGTDTFDLALAAHGEDIVSPAYDGTPFSPGALTGLDFSRTLAFQNFTPLLNPRDPEHADIDAGAPPPAMRNPALDFFTLYQFNARQDPVGAMLTQDHVASVKGFLGQATAFRRDKIKPTVVVLAANPTRTDEVKYLHGQLGQGTFTFYAGHDPEDYQHFVGDPPTDLAQAPTSPGYRLILNNVLFPAARKKPQKT